MTHQHRLMRFASHSRECALVLRQIAQDHPQFKIELLCLAHQWLTLAVIEDMIVAGAEEAEKKNCWLH